MLHKVKVMVIFKVLFVYWIRVNIDYKFRAGIPPSFIMMAQ